MGKGRTILLLTFSLKKWNNRSSLPNFHNRLSVWMLALDAQIPPAMKARCTSGATARWCLQAGIKLARRLWSGKDSALPVPVPEAFSNCLAPINPPKWMDNIRRAGFLPDIFVIFSSLMLQKYCQN